MTKKYRLRTFKKLRGDLREEIARALEKVADEYEEIEDIVPERVFNHKQKKSYFGVRRVKDACVTVGVYTSKGYGLLVNLVLKSKKGVEGIVDYMHSANKNPQNYFPEPA